MRKFTAPLLALLLVPSLVSASDVVRHKLPGGSTVAAAIDGLGPRASAVFRRHRIDGQAQRLVAEEFGVSVSTVEADLRAAYALIARIREDADEA